MLAFCPEGVDMKRFDGKYWYAQHAPKANTEYAEKAKAFTGTIISTRAISVRLRPITRC